MLYYTVQEVFLTEWTEKGITGVEKYQRGIPLYSGICLWI